MQYLEKIGFVFASRFIPAGLGWQRDLPDARDFTLDHPEVITVLARLRRCDQSFPRRIDLRKDDEGVYFLGPEDQGESNSSAAFSCLSLIEYFERRTRGRTFEASVPFVYHMACKLARVADNSAVGIRSTLKAIRRFGAPPVEMQRCQSQPPAGGFDASLFAYATDMHGLTYFRLDQANQSGRHTLKCLKAFLASRFPVAFGFSVPHSMTGEPDIPYRPTFDSYRGGQAVVAVGYDDRRLPGKQGAILIRSSWGAEWGQAGYGWLPYSYVTEGLSSDFWTIAQPSWMRSDTLCRPVLSNRRDV